MRRERKGCIEGGEGVRIKGLREGGIEMDCNEKRRGRMRIVMRREGKGCRRVEKV